MFKLGKEIEKDAFCLVLSQAQGLRVCCQGQDCCLLQHDPFFKPLLKMFGKICL